MRKDLKTEIMKVAKELFGEYGYNEISMRNIAETLGISVGNLTYHFKKKEDLVEAVVLEQHEGYQKFSEITSLKDLDAFFTRTLSHQKKNFFYFRHYVQLAQISKKVYQIQVKVLGDMKEMLTKGFSSLTASGLMKSDMVDRQQEYFVKSIMTIIIFGDTFLKQNRYQALWSLIYPLLTNEGIRSYQEDIA